MMTLQTLQAENKILKLVLSFKPPIWLTPEMGILKSHNGPILNLGILTSL